MNKGAVFKPLRELVTFKGGGTPSKQVPEYWNGDIPWASVKDFTSTSLSETQDFISEEGLKNSSANLIPKGHVIIPTRMSLGKAAINTVDMAINQDLRALVPKVPLDSKFLLQAVLSLKDEIVKKGSGATVKGITQEELYKLEIAFPPLDDQIRIAHLLGKVESLIAQRKQHLQQLDDLLRSVFLEMFGDPVRNEKGWEKYEVKDFSQSRLGKMRDKKFITGNHLRKYIGNSNVQWFRFVFDDLLEMDFDERERAVFSLQYGDLLVCEGGDIGRCAIWKNQIEDCYFQKALHRVRLNSNMALPEYIQFVFLFFSIFNGFKITSKATIAHLTGEKLAATEIPLPPLRLQAQFAAIVEKVEALKSRYQQSLADLQALYGVLSRQAFTGELDLSRVSLLNDTVNKSTKGGESAVTASKAASIIEDFRDYPLSDPKTRRRFIERAFGSVLMLTKEGREISMKDFWAGLAWDGVDLVQEGDLPFKAKDYDLVKKLIFDAIARGEIVQTRNQIEVGEEVEFGNEVILKKAL